MTEQAEIDSRVVMPLPLIPLIEDPLKSRSKMNPISIFAQLQVSQNSRSGLIEINDVSSEERQCC